MSGRELIDAIDARYKTVMIGWGLPYWANENGWIHVVYAGHILVYAFLTAQILPRLDSPGGIHFASSVRNLH